MRDKICRNEENAAATFSESTRTGTLFRRPVEARDGAGDKRYQ